MRIGAARSLLQIVRRIAVPAFEQLSDEGYMSGCNTTYIYASLIKARNAAKRERSPSKRGHPTLRQKPRHLLEAADADVLVRQEEA